MRQTRSGQGLVMKRRKASKPQGSPRDSKSKTPSGWGSRWSSCCPRWRGCAARGGFSLYACLVYISPRGRIESAHRKLMPTHHERLFHGFGSGEDLGVVETPVGRIGPPAGSATRRGRATTSPWRRVSPGCIPL